MRVCRVRVSMLCDHAQALLIESSRSSQTRSLLPVNQSALRSLLRESHSLSQSLDLASSAFAPSTSSQSQSQAPSATLEIDNGVRLSLIITATSLNRNFRALLAYQHQRVEVLKEKFWHKGGGLSRAFGIGTETRKGMGVGDEEFVKAYAGLCLQFKESWYGALGDEEHEDEACQLMDAMDLLGGGVGGKPPRDLFVSVRVVKDVGDVETASGDRLHLSKGSQYYLAREDVEGWLVGGELEIIE